MDADANAYAGAGAEADANANADAADAGGSTILSVNVVQASYKGTPVKTGD